MTTTLTNEQRLERIENAAIRLALALAKSFPAAG
jgi:hypothetical protein